MTDKTIPCDEDPTINTCTLDQANFILAYCDIPEDTMRYYRYSLPDQSVRYENSDQLVRMVKDSGSHFFDDDTLKFFNSKMHGSSGFLGRFFVTSERFDDNAREYSVRWTYRYSGSRMIQCDRFTKRFTSLAQAVNFAALCEHVF